MKEFYKYVTLNIMGMLGLSCYIMADTFFIAKAIGTDGLTALNLAIPVYSFIHGTGLLIGMGGATKYAIFRGQKSYHNANKIFTNALFMAITCFVLFVITGLFKSVSIAKLLGADGRILNMTNTYLKMLLLFSPAFLLNDLMICFIRNDGGPKLAMVAMLTGSFANILLDYVFLFIIPLGIFGAVLATGFAPIISISILSFHFWKKKNQFKVIRMVPQFGTTKTIFSLGISSFIIELASGIVMIVFNAVILSIEGNTGVAAYGVVANVYLVIISIFTGLAQGAQPLMSREYGRDNKKALHDIFKYAVITGVVLALMIYCVLYFTASPLTKVFNSENNHVLQLLAEQGMRIYFLATPFVAINVITSMYCTSTENVIPAQVISLFRGIVIIIPVTLILSKIFKMTGVWSSFPATEGCISMMIVVYVLLRMQKR